MAAAGTLRPPPPHLLTGPASSMQMPCAGCQVSPSARRFADSSAAGRVAGPGAGYGAAGGGAAETDAGRPEWLPRLAAKMGLDMADLGPALPP